MTTLPNSQHKFLQKLSRTLENFSTITVQKVSTKIQRNFVLLPKAESRPVASALLWLNPVAVFSHQTRAVPISDLLDRVWGRENCSRWPSH
jgi:hypothetical protein